MARKNKFIKDYVAQDLFSPKYRTRSVPNKKKQLKLKGFKDDYPGRSEYDYGHTHRGTKDCEVAD